MVDMTWNPRDFLDSGAMPPDLPAPDYTPHALPIPSAHPDAPMLLDEGPSSPPYTPEAHEHEWSLHAHSSSPQTPIETTHLPRLAPVAPTPLAQPLGADNPLLWNPTNAYCFGGDMLAVSLGRRFWGLRHPAYGAHGEVNGYVRLGKKLTHAMKVTVSVCMLFPRTRACLTSGC